MWESRRRRKGGIRRFHSAIIPPATTRKRYSPRCGPFPIGRRRPLRPPRMLPSLRSVPSGPPGLLLFVLFFLFDVAKAQYLKADGSPAESPCVVGQTYYFGPQMTFICKSGNQFELSGKRLVCLLCPATKIQFVACGGFKRPSRMAEYALYKDLEATTYPYKQVCPYMSAFLQANSVHSPVSTKIFPSPCPSVPHVPY